MGTCDWQAKHKVRFDKLRAGSPHRFAPVGMTGWKEEIREIDGGLRHCWLFPEFGIIALNPWISIN
jgi:transposase